MTSDRGTSLLVASIMSTVALTAFVAACARWSNLQGGNMPTPTGVVAMEPIVSPGDRPPRTVSMPERPARELPVPPIPPKSAAEVRGEYLAVNRRVFDYVVSVNADPTVIATLNILDLSAKQAVSKAVAAPEDRDAVEDAQRAVSNLDGVVARADR